MLCPIGEHALAGALRFYGRGALEGEPLGEAVLRRYFNAALLSGFATRRLMNTFEFTCVSVLHGIYVPEGLIGEVARQQHDGLRPIDQIHPSHRHIEKEETFQVLSGSVDLVLNGQNYQLQSGQKQLIERGLYHSFSMETGAILEEVSTTHIKGDSEYEDESIPSDPTTRKTRIELLV